MYENTDIGVMNPITKTLDALLLISGLKRTKTQRMDLTGLNGLFINRLSYVNSAGEQLFIYSQEKQEIAKNA